MTDAYFLGLQQGAQKGEADAAANLVAIPLPPAGLSTLEAGFKKGYTDGYQAAYDKVRLLQEARIARLRAERLLEDYEVSRLDHPESSDRDER